MCVGLGRKNDLKRKKSRVRRGRVSSPPAARVASSNKPLRFRKMGSLAASGHREPFWGSFKQLLGFGVKMGFVSSAGWTLGSEVRPRGQVGVSEVEGPLSRKARRPEGPSLRSFCSPKAGKEVRGASSREEEILRGLRMNVEGPRGLWGCKRAFGKQKPEG